MKEGACPMEVTKSVRSTVLVFLILTASAAIATAGIIQDLTVNLQLNPCSCYYDTGYDGSPAVGTADFTSIAPWTITFGTGDALSWYESPNSYLATFGAGGVFDMTGPYGLTFSGVVTSGQSGYAGFQSFVDVTFSGNWSDGLYGYGDAELYFTGGSYESDLNAYASAPEPSSLGLMASGLLGIWGYRKQVRAKQNNS
jgi:PEP-CTERM motif